MQKWEYTVWYLDTSVGVASIHDELERRGNEGWELVATPVVWDFDPDNNGRQLVGILKRPVGAEAADARDVHADEPVLVSGMVDQSGAALVPYHAALPERPTRSSNSLVHIGGDRSAAGVVDEMIRRAEADLLAIKRHRLVADDEHKRARTTHLEVELHLLRQSRAWVSTDADVAWVQSGLEAWRSAYGLRQQPRPEWFARLRDNRRRRVRASRPGSGTTLPRSDDFVDADELRRLLEQTTGCRIGFLLAQECAAALIVRDPSRTDRDVENILESVVGRKVIGRTRIAILRKRMEASGVIPALDRRHKSWRWLQPAHK